MTDLPAADAVDVIRVLQEKLALRDRLIGDSEHGRAIALLKLDIEEGDKAINEKYGVDGGGW